MMPSNYSAVDQNYGDYYRQPPTYQNPYQDPLFVSDPLSVLTERVSALEGCVGGICQSCGHLIDIRGRVIALESRIDWLSEGMTKLKECIEDQTAEQQKGLKECQQEVDRLSARVLAIAPSNRCYSSLYASGSEEVQHQREEWGKIEEKLKLEMEKQQRDRELSLKQRTKKQSKPRS